MAKFDKATLAILLLGLIMLCGCQDLVPHDTQSLLAPSFQRSEIIWLSSRVGNNVCRGAGSDNNDQTSIKRGFEPGNGSNHRRLSDFVGLLWFVDRFATGDRMERGRGVDQFPMCRRIPSFRPQRKSRTEEGLTDGRDFR